MERFRYALVLMMLQVDYHLSDITYNDIGQVQLETSCGNKTSNAITL